MATTTSASDRFPVQGDPAAAVKILLDTPAAGPSRDVEPVAAAFAQIIENSTARFAIGIFGDWGSGKTTLMNAIEARLRDDVSIIVPFNAWRFEREEHLLVPLLDTVRLSLAKWANSRPATDEEKTRAERARGVARRIGRVVRAFGTGLSAEVGAPGAKAKLDIGTVIDSLGDAGEDEAERPQSLYFAGFQELNRAFEEFAKDGAARIVVFVDDLDRCLPANALEVLESMKLFFDLPGFVFVVGLDEQVVQRAVRSKLGDETQEASRDGQSEAARFGRDYVKKIFQVPYSLPAVVTDQLPQLLESMYAEAGIEGEQLIDLGNRVEAFIDHVAVSGRINPREVKRFINAYTLQMLVRPELDRDTVLALQTITFRDDWDAAYSALLADAEMVTDAMKRYSDGEDGALLEIWPATTPIPSDLPRFIRSKQARPLFSGISLDPYLFSLQSARGSNPELIQVLRDVGQLRRLARGVADIGARGDPQAQSIASGIAQIVSRVQSEPPRGVPDADAKRFTAALQRVSDIFKELMEPSGEAVPPGLRKRLDDAVEDVARELTVLRSSSVLPP